MPTLTVIAGPNGPGKSTLTSSIWFEGSANLIDPDAIARRLDAAQPAREAIPAAREAILRCKALLADRASFTLETTLAGKGAMGIVRQAKNAGYQTVLVYVSLGDPELHIERVRLRVSKGGHDIPDADIRRRYWPSLMRAGSFAARGRGSCTRQFRAPSGTYASAQGWAGCRTSNDPAGMGSAPRRFTWLRPGCARPCVAAILAALPQRTSAQSLSRQFCQCRANFRRFLEPSACR